MLGRLRYQLSQHPNARGRPDELVLPCPLHPPADCGWTDDRPEELIEPLREARESCAQEQQPARLPSTKPSRPIPQRRRQRLARLTPAPPDPCPRLSAQVAPRVTAVLLSHPDVAHLGALPYAVSKLGLKAPVFCTTPVRKMGHHFLQDLCRSRATDEAPAFALEDVDAAFHLVQASSRGRLPSHLCSCVPPLMSCRSQPLRTGGAAQAGASPAVFVPCNRTSSTLRR